MIEGVIGLCKINWWHCQLRLGPSLIWGGVLWVIFDIGAGGSSDPW